MANHCSNYVTVFGNEIEIKLLSELILNAKKDETHESAYSHLLEIFSEGKVLNDDPRWFDIDIDNIEETSFTITGDSCWCPCLELFKTITKVYTSLEFYTEYEEMGCDFAGFATIKNCEINDNCFSYWIGMIAMNGETQMADDAINNELSYYDSEEELTGSDMYKAFDKEMQALILKEYSKIN